MTEQERVLNCLEYFTEPGDIIEVRAFLPAGAVCGWFRHEDLGAAARAVADLERSQATGIYFTPNPVAPAAARRLGQIGPATVCTRDADILRRRWLLIDIDPTRPTGSNSSEAERAAAWQVASHVQAIMGAAGLVAPIIGSSGNGWHLCYPIDWPNDDDSRTRHKIILAELAKRCDTSEAAVDCVTYNAARIWKLYGTRARKGPNTGDRPQRIAFVASAPAAALDPATRETNNRAIDVGLVGAWARQSAALQSLERQRTEPDTVARARAYLAKIPGAVSGSGGHGQTYHAAMELVEGFGLDQETALALLREWNQTCVPPWTEPELAHKINSAAKNAKDTGRLLNAGRQTPAARPAPRPAARYTGPESVPESICEDVPEEDPDATAADLIALQATITWTWPGWIQRGTLTCLASDPGIGKTRLCADIAKRLWLGLPWPDGTPATHPVGSRVMWIAADSQWAELGTIPGEFGFAAEAIVLNGNRSNPYAGTNLDSIEDLAALERRIRRVQPVVVFIDTCGNATDRNQGRTEEAKAFFKPLAEIATRCNVSIVLVTHLNRGGQVLGNRIVGAVRQVINLDAPDATAENRRRLQVSKTNSKKPPALGVTMDSTGNEYDMDPPRGADDVGAEPGRPAANLGGDMDWLREALAMGPKRVSHIRNDAQASGIGSSRLYKAKDGAQVEQFERDGKQWWRLSDD